MNEVYKIKQTATGADKILLKDDSFNPPTEVLDDKFEKVSKINRSIIRWSLNILGTKKLLKWELAKKYDEA